ncbi:hypothetical protein KQI68_01455 [Peptoniphilus sp. MSJ-1]|uniref:Uncharacterized protein n=1 Tax=Peptoniphilus ovalis TaxID=2841503 RepID=A0ABS6FE89_9FIRM|nr:hypothetical protein [Peptoniphilus ovalis]MBU5668498.1 hypothetical protein [Peptoniphilus ovalis]
MRRLTNKNKTDKKGTQLTNRKTKPFRIAICGSLENKFDFKELDNRAIKQFHKFIEETIGKNLTITEVDKQYLRTKGTIKEEKFVHGEKRDIMHYGKDEKPFRIFGYYNTDSYFTITRLDSKHKTHKE